METMRKLRQLHKAESLGVASEPEVTSTSCATQVMNIVIDSEQSTQSSAVSEERLPV